MWARPDNRGSQVSRADAVPRAQPASPRTRRAGTAAVSAEQGGRGLAGGSEDFTWGSLPFRGARSKCGRLVTSALILFHAYITFCCTFFTFKIFFLTFSREKTYEKNTDHREPHVSTLYATQTDVLTSLHAQAKEETG